MSRRRLRIAKDTLGLTVALGAILAALPILRQLGLETSGLLAAGLLAMTPIALASIGECINEKAGNVNIGIEGIFLMSALVGVYGAEVLNDGYAGLLVGAMVGAFIGLAMGLAGTYGRANQIIVGMGVNVFALGFVPYSLMAIWAFPGIHIFPRELKIPLVSTPIGLLSPLTFLTIAVAVLAHIMLHRTLLGLRIKACGERPEALDVAGISVEKVRVLSSVVGGALAGLGGAFMPLAWFGGIVKEIAAGRGFIALAVVVFAGLEPLPALAASFIFGFTEGFSFWATVTPGVKEVIPYQFVLMMPYIVALAVVTIAIGKKRFPSAIGKPYVRE